MAKLGFGMLVIMQNEWPKAAEDIQRYREITASVGHAPRPPIILDQRVGGREPRGGPRARGDVPGRQVGLDRHALPLLGRPSGHGEGLRVLRRDGQDLLQDEGRELPRRRRRTSTSRSRSWARPTTASSRSPSCSRLTGLDHLVTEFGFGGMPHEEAELNMRMFADRVMPMLQRDAAFRTPTSTHPTEPVRHRRLHGHLRPSVTAPTGGSRGRPPFDWWVSRAAPWGLRSSAGPASWRAVVAALDRTAASQPPTIESPHATPAGGWGVAASRRPIELRRPASHAAGPADERRPSRRRPRDAARRDGCAGDARTSRGGGRSAGRASGRRSRSEAGRRRPRPCHS